MVCEEGGTLHGGSVYDLAIAKNIPVEQKLSPAQKGNPMGCEWTLPLVFISNFRWILNQARDTINSETGRRERKWEPCQHKATSTRIIDGRQKNFVTHSRLASLLVIHVSYAIKLPSTSYLSGRNALSLQPLQPLPLLPPTPRSVCRHQRKPESWN